MNSADYKPCVRGACRSKQRPLAIIATAGMFSVAVSAATTGTYYVDPNGDDSASGSQTQPWRTVQHAASLAKPGDTVLVSAGVYREQIKLSRSGTARQRIVFKNAGRPVPVIDGDGLAIGNWGALVALSNVSYIHMEGFEIRNSPRFLSTSAGNRITWS